MRLTVNLWIVRRVGVLAGLAVLAACSESTLSGQSGRQTNDADSRPPPEPTDGDSDAGDDEPEDEVPKDDRDKIDSDDTIEPDKPEGDPLAGIDAACANPSSTDKNPPVTPKGPLLARTVPDDCRVGIEVNNLKSAFALGAKSSKGARGLKLEVDLATYRAPDHVRMMALGDFGERVIFDSCRLSTANYADPTGGARRPPEDSIRDYRVALPKGTKSLSFDFTRAETPTYLRVIGLCDFGLTAPGVPIRTVTD